MDPYCPVCEKDNNTECVCDKENLKQNIKRLQKDVVMYVGEVAGLESREFLQNEEVKQLRKTNALMLTFLDGWIQKWNKRQMKE